MISDHRTGEPPKELHGDVCIVGSGPAGMTLALELAARGRRVVLLEGGGEEFEEDSQELYRGRVESPGHIDVAYSRLRQFGGTSGHWTGMCAPLDPIDFEARPGSPDHGWPIRRGDLDPFYARAQSYLDLGPYGYEWRDWSATIGKPALRLDPATVQTVFFQQSPPTRFAAKYLEKIRADPRIDCRLHANLIDVALREGSDAVDSVTVSTLDGKRTAVKAGRFVLACGGVENARILLNARSRRPAGLGNEHGLVGRYYTDHIIVQTSLLVLNDAVDSSLYWLQQPVGGAVLQPALRVAPELVARENLTNNHMLLVALHDDPLQRDDFRNHGWIAFTAMLRAFSAGRAPDQFAARYCDVADDAGAVASGVFRHAARHFRGAQEPRAFTLRQDAEQVPNPDSRVTLTEEKDRLGLNRVLLDWRVSTEDLLKLRRSHEIVGEAVGAAGLGRLRLGIPEKPDPSTAYSGYHHMGTTRMHDDPKRGVVDADCRIHSVRNLYVAGSSVFTTGGCANPTLTIVALAIRLADRLAAQA